METPAYHSALIVGVGPGLSASLARLFGRNGLRVALAARQTDKLAQLCSETGASAHACDAADPAQVESLFKALDATQGAPDLVVYNASGRLRGPLTDLDPEEVARAVTATALGAFHVGRQAARRMLPTGRGGIALTGATAGVKGFAGSAPFAMGKFALRALAQSMARELAPRGIHVAHFVIDGGIGPAGGAEGMLDPDAIAQTYWHVMTQDRSAWTWEVELRPWTERF
jgi:NAD(P)-dependent dehydrogenase (short-subunit alcohol dehydrogenase family)